ncbi:hypothetical protein BKA82DRAFT_1003365 [Pisolithus tinctorius]|uniref:Transmembrane protein n=1 Tax=Pisolithus tinctorius Marx 270 TaxID=870435 RepID=A0A0C3P148_PISTI|nr:hypothetical protein BKA82DRAFT_1003365 [Pisolithus tinctorius]KIO01084.1 hypothetical protein M404DRAFT_1003365 [Pisolithus tinctorius Marx 270]
MNANTNAVSRISTVIGHWRGVSQTSMDVDVEAQTITGYHAPLPSPAIPEQARSAAAPTRTPASADETAPTSDPIDDFFGITRPRATRESRHDSYPSVSSRVGVIAMDGEAPPPYVDGAELPAYTVAAGEPATLAMYLFKFGFLFPPFWILGAMILLSPLHAPAEFEPTKPEAARQELICMMRVAEIRWAKRCAWALLILVLALGVTAGVVVAVMKST